MNLQELRAIRKLSIQLRKFLQVQLSTVLLAITIPSAAVGSPHLPVLADARAVRSVGAVAASPNAEMLAYEENGINVCITSVRPCRTIAHLKGGRPTWLPDGSGLVFYSVKRGMRQISVWHRGNLKSVVLTQFDGGISPNFFSNADPLSYAISPDSKNIAFTSRKMGRFLVTGGPFPSGGPVSSLDGTVRSTVSTTNSLFRHNFWDVLTVPKFDDMSPFRMRAMERHPELGRNFLYILNIASRQVTAVPDRCDYDCRVGSRVHRGAPLGA